MPSPQATLLLQQVFLSYSKRVSWSSLPAKHMKSFASSNTKTRIEKSNSIDPIGVVVTAL